MTRESSGVHLAKFGTSPGQNLQKHLCPNDNHDFRILYQKTYQIELLSQKKNIRISRKREIHFSFSACSEEQPTRKSDLQRRVHSSLSERNVMSPAPRPPSAYDLIERR